MCVPEVKEAAMLDLNRIKAEEWTPRCFPITAEFSLPHIVRTSMPGYTVSMHTFRLLRVWQ